jgi:hypothetical protein
MHAPIGFAQQLLSLDDVGNRQADDEAERERSSSARVDDASALQGDVRRRDNALCAILVRMMPNHRQGNVGGWAVVRVAGPRGMVTVKRTAGGDAVS